MIAAARHAHGSERVALLTQAAWYLVVALGLLGSIALTHYFVDSAAERRSRETSERLNVTLGGAAIVSVLESVESDLSYLADRNAAHGLLRIHDEAAMAALGREFVAFAEHKRIYDQVRLLDSSGMEAVRVNFSDGEAHLIGKKELQDKAGRYYFQQTWGLDRGEIYVSPFDLNVERGRVEVPPKPMIRIGTPLFNSRGRKVGVLLLNYLGERLLERFRTGTANIGDHVMLLNANGFWLSSPRREDEWGFMRGDEYSFATVHPEAWRRIQAADSAQFEASGRVYTFKTVFPLLARPGAGELSRVPAVADAPHARPWKIVSVLPLASLNSAPGMFVRRHWTLYLVMLLLLGVAAVLLSRATVRHRLAEAQIAFERRFREVLENVSLKVVAVDLEGHIIFCNDSLLALVRWERADLLGKNWVDTLVVPERREACARILSEALHGNDSPVSHESMILTRDGERRLMVWHDAPMLGAEGMLLGITLLGEDITDSRSAQERILLLSRAVEQSPSTVMITDTTGAIEYVNPKFTTLTGYSLDEVRGENPRLLQSGNTSLAAYRRLWETITGGGEWRGVIQNRKRNGELYWEAATISAVRNLQGDIAHYLAVKEDITERRRLEERFRHCVESAPSAMVLADAGGSMVLVNREVERMFGYPREDLLGQPVEMLLPVELGEAHDRYRQSFVQTRESRPMGAGRELFARHRGGHLFPVEIGLHTIKSDEGVLALATIVDITQRIRLEQQLRQRDQEVARSQALAAVGRMANMVAHDFRNPLSSIKMGLQIISKHRAGRSAEEELEIKKIALQQVHFLEEIIDDMLVYTREDSMAPQWLQVDKLLDTSVMLVQRYIEEHQISITTRYQAGLPTLHGDATKLRRAFSNLVLNAAQSTEGMNDRKPEIIISAQLELAPNRPCINLEIVDNGCGLEPESRDKLFEPFYTTRAMGTGLGLAIVKRIIEQHHGTVALIPGEITGTRVRITLPTGPLDATRLGGEPDPVGETLSPGARNSGGVLP